MDNQHRKIQGYNELSQEEIDLINEVKEMEARLNALIEKLHAENTDIEEVAIADQESGVEQFATALFDSETQRWIRIGQDQIQLGLMALTRAIANPSPLEAPDE